MTPTTGYATKEELYQVKQDLSKRIGDVELSLSLKMGNMQASIDTRFDTIDARFDAMQADIDARFEEVKTETRRVDQNMMSMFAALFAHLGIDTPPLQ